VRKAGRILLAATLALGAVPPAGARAQSQTPATSKTRGKASPAGAAGDALPCARAKYKNDPICFGENDPTGLPVPSGGARADDTGVTAKTRPGDPKLDPNLGDSLNTHPGDGQSGVGVHF
jgi:hypothetical protein